MYVKLILRNAVRSIKDYLVYIVTMTLCVAMFYAFMSITSRYYNPDVGVQFDLTLLIGLLKVAVLGITCLIIFLVNYVNRFMIQRRQREFALQTIMGMERKTTAGIFFSQFSLEHFSASIASTNIKTFNASFGYNTSIS